MAMVCIIITGSSSNSSNSSSSEGSILCRQHQEFQHCYLSLPYIKFRVNSSDPHIKSLCQETDLGQSLLPAFWGLYRKVFIFSWQEALYIESVLATSIVLITTSVTRE